MSSLDNKIDIPEASLSPPTLEVEEVTQTVDVEANVSDTICPSSGEVAEVVCPESKEIARLTKSDCKSKDEAVLANLNSSTKDPVPDLPAPVLPAEMEKRALSPGDTRKRILDSMKSQFNSSSEEDSQTRAEPVKSTEHTSTLSGDTTVRRFSHRSKSKLKHRSEQEIEASDKKEVLEYKTLPMNEEEQKQLEDNALVPPVKIRIRGRKLATVDSAVNSPVVKQEATYQTSLPADSDKPPKGTQQNDVTGPLRRSARTSSSDTSSLELNSEQGTRRSSRIKTASPSVGTSTTTSAATNSAPNDPKTPRGKRAVPPETSTPEPKRAKPARPSTRAKRSVDLSPPSAAIVPLAIKQQEMIVRLQSEHQTNAKVTRSDNPPVLSPIAPLDKDEHMASLGLRSTSSTSNVSAPTQTVNPVRRTFKPRRRHYRGIRYAFGNKRATRNLKLKLQLEKRAKQVSRGEERTKSKRITRLQLAEATVIKQELTETSETMLNFKPSVLSDRMQTLMASPLQLSSPAKVVVITKETPPRAGLIASDAKLTSRKLLQAANQIRPKKRGSLNTVDEGITNGSAKQGNAVAEFRPTITLNTLDDKEANEENEPRGRSGRTRRETAAGGKTSDKSPSSETCEDNVRLQANPTLGRILCHCRENRTPVALGSGLSGSSPVLQQPVKNTQVWVPAPLMLCQAVDSVGSRLLGCSHKISSHKLRRPAARIPFMLLCGIHKTRLVSHQCCPGCGLFCTQGNFLVCKWETGNPHYYHAACQLEVDGQGLCPHCGSANSSDEVILHIKAKELTCTQDQQPAEILPNAKISFSSPENKTIGKRSEEELPVFIPLKLTLPSNKEITVEGLPEGFEKEMLEGILKLMNGKISSKSGPKNLYSACKNGDLEKILHCLAAGQVVNQRLKEHSSQTPLHAAVSTGHLAAAHILVQAGAELDIMDKDLCTPLMLAIIHGHAALVKYLIKANASVTLKGRDGMTSLHMSAKYGSLESCHYIVSLGSSNPNLVNMQDDGGWTALVWGCEHKRIDIVRYLLQWKADPLLRDTEQNICLHWSAFSGSMEISELLLNKGCDVNTRNANGETPLHIAARKDNYECVMLFLSRGADVTLPNNEGETALTVCPNTHCQSWMLININSRLKDLVTQSLDNSEKLLCNDITKGKEQNPIQCVNGYDAEPMPTDYVYVTENCFTSHIQVDRTITSLQHCRCTDNCSSSKCFCSSLSFRCWYDEESRLVPEFNFLDPPMLFECNRACECHKIMCHNRVVQHGITVRTLLFRTPTKGWGIRTLKPIRKGSFVCEYIGEIISDSEADLREDDSYLFDLDNRDGETYCIDARRYGNVARFINHACDPNLIPVKVFMDHQDLRFPRIAFFASRDIEAYEELGFDYGDKFWIIKYKTFTCTCGSPKCKYSDTSIHQTLVNYQRRLQQEEAAHSASATC